MHWLCPVLCCGSRASGCRERYLSLFEAAEVSRAPEGYGTTGFNHLGFEVDDLAAYRETLLNMGVEIKGEDDYEPGRRLYFYDPDGIEMELVEY